jgi:fibronectin-binding autotransporter adhesin
MNITERATSMRFRPIPNCLIALSAFALGLLGADTANAQVTYTWNNPVGGSWNTPTNWTSTPGGVATALTLGAPANNTANFSTLALPGTATVTLDGNQTIGNLTFGDANATPTFSWILNPGSVSTSTLTLETSSLLNPSPAINVVNETATLNVILTGTQGFTKSGAGALTLAGANTYSGTTILSTGQLNINSSTALGTSALTISAGTTFDNTSGAAITLTTNNVQTWNGNFTFGATNALNLGTGAVTLGANVQVTVNGPSLSLTGGATNLTSLIPLTLGGAIGGAHSLTVAGTGVLQLTGASNYSGGTTVSSGSTLVIGNGTTVGSIATGAGIMVNGGGTIAYFISSNAVTLGGAVTGAGSIYLQGTNTPTNETSEFVAGYTTGFTGTIAVANARLQVASAAVLGGSTAINVLPGGQLFLSSAATLTQTITLAGTGWNDSGNLVQVAAQAGAIRYSSASILQGNVILAANARISPNSTGGIIQGNISGAFTLDVGDGGSDGSGNLTLSPNVGNTVSAIMITGSTNNATLATATNTLILGNNNAFPASSGIALIVKNGGTLSVNGTTSNTVGNLTGYAGGIIENFATTVTTGSAATITIGTTSTTLSSYYAGTIINGGTPVLNVVKAGPNTLTLAGVNSYAGTTIVAAGTLAIASPSSLPTASATTVNDGATLSFYGYTSTVTAPTLTSLTLGNSSGATLGFVVNGALTTPALNITNFTLNGTTTINFSSSVFLPNNTTISLFNYTTSTGSTAFNLTLPPRATGNLNPTPGSPNKVSLNLTTLGAITWAPGTANWDVGSTITTGGTAGAGASGGGTLNWSIGGSATNFVPNDAVIFDSTASSGAVTVTTAVTPSSVTFNNTTTLAYTLTGPGSIGGSGAVAINGGGTVTMAVANTYAGGTIVNSGQLNINTPTAIGPGALTMNGGTINNTSGAAITLTTNNVQTWSGSFAFGGTNALNLGTGAVTLTTNVTVTVNGNSYNPAVGFSPTLNPTISPLSVGGIISGAFSLTVVGSGVMFLGSSNTAQAYTGGTTIGTSSPNSGTLVFGLGGPVITGGLPATGTILINKGGTLGYWAEAITPPYSAITGSGTLYLDGTNQLIGTSAASIFTPSLTTSFTGTLAVANGRLDPGTFGNTSAIVIEPGGQLITTGGTGTIPITIAGNGWFDSATAQAGAIRLFNSQTIAGNITLSANARISSTSGTNLITGNIFSQGFQLEIGNGGADGNVGLTLMPPAGGGNAFSTVEVSTSGTIVIAGNANAFPSPTNANSTTPAALLMNGGAVQLNSFSFTFANVSGTGIIENNLSGVSTISIGSDNTNTTYSGTLINGAAGGTLALAKVGTGTLTLTGGTGNTFTGGTSIQSGILSFSSGSLGTSSAQTIAFTGNSTLQWNGTNTQDVSSQLVIDDGVTGTVDINGNNLVFANTIQLGPLQTGALRVVTSIAGGTLTISGNNNFQTLQVGTGALSGGKVTLSGQDSSLNTATVTSGILRVQAGSVGTSAAVAVQTGATLSVFDTTTSGAFSSTLQVGSLSLTSANLSFELNGANPTSVPLVTVGNLGGLSVSGGVTINVTNAGTQTTTTVGNPITLVQYAATSAINSSLFSLGALPTPRTAANLVFSFSTATDTGLIQLNISSVAGSITWTGAVTGGSSPANGTIWNAGASPGNGGMFNWIINTNSTNFVVGDSVIFSDAASSTSASTAGAITVVGTVSPSTVTFINNALAYSFTGTGVIAGAANGVTISGGGTVSVATANTYTGGTTLALGQLNINANGTSASSPIGTGPLTIGTLTGPSVTIDNTSSGAVTLSTNNAQTWNGNFTFGGTQALNLGTGTVQLGQQMITVTVNGSHPLTVGGTISDTPIGGSTQGFGLTVNGASTGVLSLSGPSAYTGSTTINGGTLQYLDSPTANFTSPATSSITVNSGGTLLFSLNVNNNSPGSIGYSSTITTPIGGAGNWTLAAVPEINPTTRTIYIFSGDLSGFTGTLTINNSDSFRVQSGFNLGNGAAQIVVNPGGQFYLLTSANVSNPISIAGNGPTEASGALGAIRFQPGTYAGNITLTANAGVSAYDSAVSSITGTISGPYQFAMISGLSPGNDQIKLTPSGPNTYGSTRVDNTAATGIESGTSGSITLSAGNANAFSSGGLSLAGSLTTGGLAILELGGFNFSFANLSSDNAFAQINNVTVNGNPNSPATITIGSDGTSTTYSGTIVDGAGAGPLSLMKVGGGTLTLTGTNTYSGGTTISGGVLQLGNGVTAGSISGPITVNSTLAFNQPSSFTFTPTGGINGSGTIVQMGPGTVTLTGPNSSFNGTVTVAAGTLRLQSGSVGTGASIAVNDGATLSMFGLSPTSTSLTVATLTLGTSMGSTLGIELAGAGPTAPAIATTTLTLHGTTTVNLSNTNVLAWSAGEIPLISYVGTQISSGFVIGTLPNQRTQASIDYSATGLVQLNVTSTGVSYWSGAHSTAWDLGSGINMGGTQNWTNGSSPTNFFTGDSVVLDDKALTTSASSPGSVTLAGPVSPSAVTFNNLMLNYSLTGNGGITGPTSVNIGGGGVVSIATASTYSGGTVLSNGQLNINANGTATSSPIGTGTLAIGAVNGPSVTIDNTSTASVTLSTNNTQIWNTNFTFGGTQALNLGTGNVQLGGNITVTVNGSHPLTVGGTISDLVGGVSQVYGLTVNGTSTGVLSLSGNSTYTGPTIINGGTLQYLDGSSLATSSITVNTGGTLLYTLNQAGGTGYSITINNSISGAGNLTLAAVPEISPITRTIYIFTSLSGFNGTLTINNSDRFNYTTSLNSSAQIVVNPGGQLYLTGGVVNNPISIAGNGLAETDGTLGAIRFQPGTYAGPITLTANAGVTAFDSTGVNLITGTITGPYQFELLSGTQGQNGSNETLTLTPTAQNTYGSTRVDNSAAIQPTLHAQTVFLQAGNAFAFSTGGLSLSGASASDLAVLQLNSFSFSFANLSSDNAFAQIQNSGSGGVSSPATITVGSDNTSTIYSGALMDGSTGTLSLAKVGTGMLSLTGVGSYSGGTTINSGTISFASGALGTGTITFAGNSTLQWNGTNTQDVSSQIVIKNGVTATIDTNGNNVTFASAFGAGSTGALTKVGNGTLVLAAQNAYTGATTLSGGIANVGAAEMAGTSGPLGNGGTILFSGGTLQYSSANQFDYSSRFSTAASEPYSVDTNGVNVTWASALSSSGGTLTKLGLGTLTLSGANTYTGTTTLAGGELDVGIAENVGTSGPLGKGGSIVFSGGTLQYSTANQFDYSSRFSTAAGQQFSVDTNGVNVTWATALASSGGTLTKFGLGILTLSGPNTYMGTTTLSGGELNVGIAENAGTSGPLGVGGSIVFSGGTLQYSSVNQFDYSSRFSTAAGQQYSVDTNGFNATWASALTSGGGALTKLGLGTLFLTANNTYGGGTTIVNGTLNINGDNALGALTSVVNLNGGTLQFALGGGIALNASRNIILGGGAFDTNGSTDTINGVISGTSPTNSNLIKNGAGTLIVTNANTYAGTTFVNVGTLSVSSTGSLGTGALVVSNANPTSPGTTTQLSLNNAAQTVGPLSGAITDPADGNTATIFLSSATTLTVNQTAAGIYQGAITGSGNLVLSGASNNTLQLSSANTYGGSTTINGGTIQSNVANALPATTFLTFAASVTGGGAAATLNLNNHDQTVTGLSGGSATSGFINTGSGVGGILTVVNSTTPTIYGGIISGNGGLTLGLNNTQGTNNTQSLTLTGPNSYTGPTTINSGALVAGANWFFNGGTALPITPPFSPLPTPYPGTFTVANVASASFNVNGFDVAIGSLQGGGPAGGNISLGSGGTLQIIESTTTVYAGVISGTGNLIVGSSAGGKLFLAGKNTFTGTTYADVIVDSTSNALPVNNVVVFSTTSSTDGLDLAGFNQQLSTISGGGSVNNSGNGTIIDSANGGSKLTIAYNPNNPNNANGGVNNLTGTIMTDVNLILDAGLVGAAQSLTLSGPNSTTGNLTVGNSSSGSPGANSGVANALIISGTSSFGALTVGNTFSSNIVNNVLVSASTGSLTVTSVNIGDAVAGSAGVNTLTVAGVLNTTGAINIGATDLYGTNALVIALGGTVTNGTSGTIAVGDQNGVGTGSLVVNGSLGSTAKPIGNVAVNFGGVLAGAGVITTRGTGAPLNINDGGTIRGGVDSGGNNLGTLTIASASGTTSTSSLTISNLSGTAPTILTEVQRSGNGTVNSSLIQMTGANKSLNLVTGTGSTGAGVIDVNLYDPTVSLVPGENYTINLVQTASTIKLNGGTQSNGTVIDSYAAGSSAGILGAGSGNQGNADLYITGNPQFANSVTGWSLVVGNSGHNLELMVFSTATPESEHMLLLCAGALGVGLAVRRRNRRGSAPGAEGSPRETRSTDDAR